MQKEAMANVTSAIASFLLQQPPNTGDCLWLLLFHIIAVIFFRIIPAVYACEVG